MGWVWQRAKGVAKDADPQRVERLAPRRWPAEPWPADEGPVCADARAIPLLPKGGAAWRPTGSQAAVMTPGTHATESWAGALHLATGERRHGLGRRTTPALCRDLLRLLEKT